MNISFSHPKVTNKPPIGVQSSFPKHFVNKTADMQTQDTETCQETKKEETKTTIKDGELKVLRKSDCNQNIIDSNSSSLEQLCNMINDLEQNIVEQGTEVKSVEEEALDVYEKFNSHESYRYTQQEEPEKDHSNDFCAFNGSTFEEIMSFLGKLEEDTISISKEHRNNIVEEFYPPKDGFRLHCSRENILPENFKEDLTTAQLQLEEKNATIQMLKDELKNERKNACEKLNSQKKEYTCGLEKQKSKYQSIIKRHQKFIEQLINEKKDLSEKCNSLVQRVKELEIRHERELKVIAERHSVELQKAKQLCAASEKIRRERWLEAKTSKIKEMTVKGLEPELRNMVEKHQQEIQEIRSIHMKELQDLELRTIRRSNQQLEQLRLELTENHEKMLANEKEVLISRYQIKLEEQEMQFENQRKKFFHQLQEERKLHVEEQSRKDAERSQTLREMTSEFQEKIEALKRQHLVEIKSLKESLQIERETWMENWKRQQNIKLEKAEFQIRDECNRERDKEIELAISRLEKESRDMKSNLQKTAENKMRYLKEKYEAELQDLSDREKLLKAKVSSLDEKLEKNEAEMKENEDRFQKCLNDLGDSKILIDKLTVEREEAKRIVRKELDSEKRELEEKIASLYRELTENNSMKDTLMAQLYSRIKLVITQKVLMINNLTKESEGLKRRCEHLEQLLDQQRKEYILKSI